MAIVTRELEVLSKKLSIDLDLVKYYLEDEDEVSVLGLEKLLSHSNVSDVLLKGVRNSPLYPEFIDNFLDERFAFGMTEDLDYCVPFKQGRKRLLNLVRENSKRTRESNNIKRKLGRDLKKYMPSLIEQGVGCLIKGSVLYGDAGKDSDVDIIFYSDKITRKSKDLVDKIRKDLSKKKTDVGYFFSLQEVEKAVGKMINRSTESIDDYFVFGDDQYKNIFSMPYDVLMITPITEAYVADENLTKRLVNLRKRTDLAVRNDPILKSTLSYRVGVNLQIRENKIKQGL